MSRSWTKPSEIFQQRVEPAWEDHTKNPRSEYYANNLAVQLNNRLEWTYTYLKDADPSRLNGATSLTSFREDLFTQHPALRVMYDLAEADKHRELTIPRDPPRTVTLSTDAYYEKDGVLYVKHYDVPFSDVAGEAREFWRKWP